MRARSLCALSLLVAAAASGCGGGPKRTEAQPSPTLAGGAPRLNPYKAAVAYAGCMRAHGVPHPDPDANGDFHLTPAQESRMRVASPRQRRAADAQCFHLLKGTVSTQPLSKGAIEAALVPLGEVRSCMRGHGYVLGKPLVRNLSRGRAMFGFRSAPPAGSAPEVQRAQHECEAKVKLAAKLDAIIKADRGEDR